MARKRQKLDELTRTAGREKVVEIQAIVDEMVKDRENRIDKALSRFINATKRKNPSHWKSASCPTGGESFPVTNVSYNDAVAYCEWLSGNDRSARYRLPTEGEWEQAAGHMPKDADFNAGENSRPTPAISYQNTLSVSGTINMWENVWEWTSITRGNQMKAVKGGAWNSKRTDCRTENREEGRNPGAGYDNVGFHIIRERTIPLGLGLRRK